MMRAAAIITLLAVPTSASAQWCYDPSCQPQQPPQRRVEPSQPRVVTKTKIVHDEPSWRRMSQDNAREWLRGQMLAFCNRYPKDVACVPPQPQQ